MEHYRIIDIHNHIYPEKIVEKATDAIGNFYGGAPMAHLGTGEELASSGKRAGIEKIVVCSAATTPKQVVSVNSFIASECEKHPEFIGFGTMHPFFEAIGEELDRVKSLGLTGIKLHPDFQEFFLDDYLALPMYRAIRDRELCLLVHVGDKDRPYSAPFRMANVIRQVPGLRLIAAHFGGYTVWQEALTAYEPGTVHFDISSSLRFMDKELIFRFFDRYGIESFFWGTDFPMWDHEEELRIFFDLGLSEEQNRKILYDNFASFYGL